MSIEKITARILQEAKAEAEAVLKRAEEEAAAAVAAAQAQADKIAADMEAKAESDAAVLIERRKSVAELEARKMRLAAKQEVIDESFAQAYESLMNLPEENYVPFLKKQLEEFEKGEVIISKEDYEMHAETFTKLLEGTPFTLSKETSTDFRRGFILKDGDVYINSSMKSLMHGEKTHIVGDLAKILFS